jgi:hypothetical protein
VVKFIPDSNGAVEFGKLVLEGLGIRQSKPEDPKPSFIKKKFIIGVLMTSSGAVPELFTASIETPRWKIDKILKKRLERWSPGQIIWHGIFEAEVEVDPAAIVPEEKRELSPAEIEDIWQHHTKDGIK